VLIVYKLVGTEADLGNVQQFGRTRAATKMGPPHEVQKILHAVNEFD